MSRLARKPVEVPAGATATLKDSVVVIKGPKGELSLTIDPSLDVTIDNNLISVSAKDETQKNPMLGTTCKLFNNIIEGVTNGFEKKLALVGVGYRASVAGSTLKLTLGHSHPIEYAFPEGITIECPSQTEIVVKGADKVKVGQVAAEVRDFRKVEPYKGKGVRYVGERVVTKEAKKK